MPELIVRKWDFPASYKIFKEYGVYKARRGDNGEVQFLDPDATTVILNALNAAPEKGRIVVLCDVDLTETIVVNKSIDLEFYGRVSADGITAIQLGDTKEADYSTIKIRQLDGVSQNSGTYGILMRNVIHAHIFFGRIVNFDKGIYFDAGLSGRAAENRIYGGEIRGCNVGVGFSSSTRWMEGNKIVASIFECSKGMEFESGGDSIWTMFIGVIDCIEIEGSKDVVDNVGHNVYLFYYVRDVKAHSSIPDPTLLIAPSFQSIFPKSLRVTENGTKGGILSAVGGLELWRDSGTPFIDFKDDEATDYDVRIIKTAAHNLQFFTGGAGAIKQSLVLEADGHVNATEYGIKTRKLYGDYGGNFTNFTPPTGEEGLMIVAVDTNPGAPGARLYIYANAAWRYVDLT